MKVTILCIQFRKSSIAALLEQKSITREIGTEVAVVFVSALDTTLEWDRPEELMVPYRGVILGGSGDFDFDGSRAKDDPARDASYVLLEQLRSLFLYIFNHDVPTLGICFGHQILGAYAGVDIHSDSKQKKIKSHEVLLCEEACMSPLFTDIPQTFKAQYVHKDVLSAVPNGAVLLVEGGDSCCISALRYKNNIYSTQFHPELNLSDLTERTELFPGYLPEGVLVQDVFEESFEANKILKNFGKLVSGGG